MPKATSMDEFYDPKSTGPGLQFDVPASIHGINVANTVAASGQVQSAIIETDGWPRAVIGVESTEAGQLSVQLYVDDAATIPQGAAITAALTANTVAVANVPNTNPFASVVITITNSSGTPATLSRLAVLLST